LALLSALGRATSKEERANAQEDELLRWARAHRVLPQIIPALPSSQTADAHSKRIERRNALLGDTLRQVAVDAAELGIVLAFPKGFSLQELYPQGQLRQFVDLDIQLASVNDLWRLHPLLEALGFSISILTLGRDQWSGRLIGSAGYSHRDAEIGNWKLEIDIQFGGLMLRGGRTYALDEEFWGSTQTLPWGNAPAPSVPHSLVLLFAEIAERKEVIFRDIVDFALLSKRIEQARLDWVAGAVRENGLGSSVRAIAKAASRSGVTAAMPSQSMEFLSRRWDRGLGLRRPQLVPKDVCVGRRRGFPPSLLRFATQCINPKQMMHRGYYVQFVPVGMQPSGPLGWWYALDEQLLRTPMGCFLPGYFGVVDDRRLLRAMSICSLASQARG
jgi:hypothetical protein